MKKKITGIMLAALLCSATSALADEATATYKDSNNSVSVDASGYRAVIITNDETGDIVYVDQSDDESFSAAASFLIKADAGAGDYTVLLGGKDGSTQPVSYKFSITKAVTPEPEVYISSAVQSEEVNETDPEKKNISFGFEEVDASKIKSIVLTLNGKSYGHDFGTEFAPGSQAVVGIKVTGIGVDTTGASAYLSSKTIQEIEASMKKED